MTLKVLPNDVRSLLIASAQINNYKTAVEELVYNSLDAESTSIAIRLHFQENRIQVIDNGCGITKIDFDALGQRYMTSKLTDLSTLKSIPKCYGYRGEFLANVIEISQYVKITSRHKDGEETWAKTFCEGKTKQLTKMTTRPSKGTTVEIKGFLYNLNIQNQRIDPINDLCNIKSFLEQLSIVHNNISLSLRDDSKNEIVFKIHKKRDVYQTLSTLFDIDKNLVQELQIEKNQYKIKALIGKQCIEIGIHCIYLNGKFIPNTSKIHIIINKYLNKYLLIIDKKKSKSKNRYDEDHLFKSNIPFYFVFITCPYMDYDTSFTLRQFVVEFKNWEQIKIMFEKLIKFYVGDTSMQKVTPQKQDIVPETNKTDNNDKTRCQIKKIVDKILGGSSKNLGISLLQNGVKGKRIKRKNKNKSKNENSPNLFPKHIKKIPLIQDKCISKITHDNKESKHLTIKEVIYENNKDSLQQDYGHKLHICNENKHIVMPKNCVRNSNVHNNKKQKIKELRDLTLAKTGYKSNNSNHKIRNKKIKGIKNINQQSNMPKLSKNRDPVHKKSKINWQKREKFLRYQNNYVTSKDNDGNSRSIASMFNRKVQYRNRFRYEVPILSNMNKCTIEKYIMHNMRIYPFKTTYDLVHTILNSQQERNLYVNDSTFHNRFRGYSSPFKPILSINEKDYPQGQKTKYNGMLNNVNSCTLTSGKSYNASNNTGRQSQTQNIFVGQSIPVESQHSLRCKDILKENSGVFYTQNNNSFYSSNMAALSALTYESHNYNHYDHNIFDNKHIKNNIIDTKKKRFTTKQSTDNFITTTNKYSCQHYLKQDNKGQCMSRTKYYNRHINRRVDKSYTIEFTQSDVITYSTKQNYDYPVNNINDETYTVLESHSPNYEPSLGFGSTYSIPSYNESLDFNRKKIDPKKRSMSNELFATNINNPDLATKSWCFDSTNNICNHGKDNSSIIFISKPNVCDDDVYIDEDIQPINLCETVFREIGSIEKEFALSFNRNSRLDDSLYNNFGNSNPNNADTNKHIMQNIRNQNDNEDISHHFGDTVLNNEVDDIKDNLRSKDIGSITNKKVYSIHDTQNHVRELNENNDPTDDGNFNFKDRLRFLPKGMSQIFQKCGSKSVCDYNLNKEYYEDIIYNDFANDVQIHTDIYEPVIQNVEDLTTKDIHKFKNKVQKDTTSLAFDEKSLKDAQVLNQVDCKFIAVIMKEKCRNFETTSEYLVLFDQHAVHERIKLEKNLAGYFNENRWKSVSIDNITLKMSKDEILYLHNYKDKFNQLGLQWSILNNGEVLVSSIPEAILGKNPREVDKVMKAVKNLIVEEINVIKLQKGCISMYPKSIMELVFSEACRYAIKFGDKLTKNDCIDLLNDLSNCKTPFQCAHGRPVMAVLVDWTSDKPEYKIDMAKISHFKLNKKTNAKN